MKITAFRDVEFDGDGKPIYDDEIIPKIHYDIEITTSKESSVCYNSTFTSIDAYYKEEKGKDPIKKVNVEDDEISEVWGVREQFDIDGLCEKINKEKEKQKHHSTAVLKGNYSGGTSGRHCKQGANYLFFDIDVKKDRDELNNPDLANNKVALAKLVLFLKEHAVLVWRSASGKGIAGVLYVPRLAGVKDTQKHLAIGNAITSYLEELIITENGIKVKFDTAQNRFRQIRYLANQREKVKLNPTPTAFHFQVSEKEVRYNGSKGFEYKYYRPEEGSIRQQFNQNNRIDEVLVKSGFKLVGDNRYKHHKTTSSSTGVVLGEIFFNHSQSFSNKYQVFDSFGLAAFCADMSIKEFEEYLKSKGFEQKGIDLEELKRQAESVRDEKSIWRIAQKVKLLSEPERRKWVISLKVNEEVRQHFINYLFIKKLSIEYDSSLKIERHVSEISTDIFDYADKEGRIVVCAETGTGKSTAIIKEFESLRPEKRLLFVAPLTVIVDQFRESGYPCLTGNSSEKEHKKALESNVVIATQEQAIKHLEHSEFDYVVIDEVHSMISANSYKDGVISELASMIKEKTLIGLTGTPVQILSDLGFKLLKVISERKPNLLIQRKDNRKPEKIILQHQKTVKGRAIYRVNSKQAIETVVEELVKFGYDPKEIAVFESSLETKLGKNYKGLVLNQKFGDEVKVVLTTALLDEGLSVYDEDFTDVVFIENEFRPNPQPLKQFMNRFRNQDEGRKCFHYMKISKEDDPKGFKNTFQSDRKRLSSEKSKSTYGAIGSDDNFINTDGSVNEFYLAYHVSERYFKSFGREEFNQYLELNYNLTVDVDWDYQSSEIEVSKSKDDREEIISDLILNHLDEVESVVHVYTLDKGLKSQLNSGFRGENEAFIKANLQRFETILKWILAIKELDYDYHKIIMPDGKIESPQKVVSKIELLRMQLALTRPKTPTDEKLKSRYNNFLEELNNLDDIEKVRVYRLWKKHVGLENPKDYILNHFIALNTKWFYDNKKSIYRIKSEYPEIWRRHFKAWYKLLPHNEVQLSMFEGESTSD
ncbi:DEAD/DEAH box helicase family protein [Robiginitalea marina]|uniref:DEAD/DEAH box helicase family protein n=1 Tax=Robiginitalea marina TaxID=2954105 RepID=A0ABT1AUD3_9FLAO|nr:DEAD/DEAH box helicase family protein [Robiginitalea marina]MCO5723225.1 DEAD/DEAH box helicase family protein [Robiginitalea marina]